MKYSFFAACGVVTLASTMTLSAQTPATPSTSPQTPAPTQPAAREEQKADQKTVTVTGCLKAWDSTMGTAPGDPMAKPGDPMAKPGDPMAKAGSTSSDATRYALTVSGTNKPSASSTSPSASSTTNPSGSAQSQGSKYIVSAGSGVNLAAHLNHQVTVTGTVAGGPGRGDSNPSASARPGETTPSTGMSGDKGAWETLTATSVTMVSATCTATN